ncbi:DNA-directed RNA polymerase II subunit RPB1 [Beauveria brongniartii RCEF 3172]|uniref:DNA-directed RNA polymerase II subunit RPB1 n=1 Tax=Beauveria brongniartii RCEF 3172 TaxID=1081107 RepID=A0A167EWH0_9HYPO|nr:DNA-directed RNA polymerase II subunit RPB1 [Beauveria brongniartii RCEF 3172]
MNASALLTAQGWRGKGHSLHKTDDAVGLAKPLLLNRKDNTKGIGATQHFTSDQWWMNAFDEQLQGLDTSKKGKVVQTITTGKLNAIEKGSLGKYSLYATFVRGGFLQGTIEALNKQKDDMDESTTDSDFETAEKKTKQNAPPKESKEERRARKEAKRKRREEKDQRKLARESKKSKSKSDSSDDAAEEKRRRRARKEERRRLRKEEAGQ